MICLLLTSLFVTITPDDGHDPNRIRLSIPQNNNFPAEPEAFLDALQKCDPFYYILFFTFI